MKTDRCSRKINYIASENPTIRNYMTTHKDHLWFATISSQVTSFIRGFCARWQVSNRPATSDDAITSDESKQVLPTNGNGFLRLTKTCSSNQSPSRDSANYRAFIRQSIIRQHLHKSDRLVDRVTTDIVRIKTVTSLLENKRNMVQEQILKRPGTISFLAYLDFSPGNYWHQIMSVSEWVSQSGDKLCYFSSSVI